MQKYSAPICAAMQKYSADGVIPFHTPGHKQGRGAHELLRELLTAEGLRQEVSLMEELDDLHEPHSCIKRAQELAARLWHADECLFMINGTTSAIQAMIFGTLKAGDLIMIPRNAHRSVISGLILSGAMPIFLPVDFDEEFNLPLNVRVETIQRAIKKFPQAKAVLLVSPNYYGVAADLEKISQLVHAAGMSLLIDEAHGAHLQFCPQLPTSAMDAGADLSAQSTHKILGSLTQSSMLLLKKNFSERVKLAASLLQTTSPNQLLLASLDIARLQMELDGTQKISAALELSKRLRAGIKKIPSLKIFEAVKNFSLDPTKVTVNVQELGLTGQEAERILRHDFKIQCELSDAANLLFLITFADTEETISKLVAALKLLPTRPKKSSPKPLRITPYAFRIATLSPRETFYSPTKIVPLINSVGQICAEEITFYPPGIPILMPGEKISAQVVELVRQSSGRVIGASDPSLSTIKIVARAPRQEIFY